MKKPNKEQIRKNIKDNLEQIQYYNFKDYPFKSITLKNIQDLFNKYAKDNNLDINSMYLETICNSDRFDELYIYGYKNLTPQEIEKEVEELYQSEMYYYKLWQQQQKIKREEKVKREKQEYERLKKKYGP